MATSPRDQRHHEPRSPLSVVTEFPGWELPTKGTDQMWHTSRPGYRPVTGEDLTDLRDMIMREESRHDDDTSSRAGI